MFEYASLTISTAFRLVKVSSRYPAQNDDVSFDLIVVNTNEAPEYTALSYQWGSDRKTHAILLNGEHFPLHENLWHFLRQLTIDKDDNLYWVDAICINQNNSEERAQQVSRMADIFTSAHQVTVWLGPLQHIQFSLEVLLHDRPVDSALSNELGASKTLTQINALNEILNLEYWRRAWILPELVLGKQIRLKCLSTYTSMAAFSAKIKHYISQRNAILTEFDEPAFTDEQKRSWTRSSFLWSDEVIKSLSILTAVADLTSGAQSFNIESWLPIVQKQGCQDARDRVYSLLGLLRLTTRSGGTVPSIPVHYGKPVGHVYWDTIFALLSSRSEKLDRRFMGEVAHLITYTDDHLTERDTSAITSQLACLSLPRFFMSLSAYVGSPDTSDRLSALAQRTLFHAFTTAVSFNHRHFYEAIGSVSKEHDTLHVQSENTLAAYLGQHIAIYSEPYVLARLGREIKKDTYTWHCKDCHQPLDDVFDYRASDTGIHYSTLTLEDCSSCSRERSRIYTATRNLLESRDLGGSDHQLRNTFKSTPVGPEIELEYRESDGVGLLTLDSPTTSVQDEMLFANASPNFYRQENHWMSGDWKGHDYRVPVPPIIVLAVARKTLVPTKHPALSEGHFDHSPDVVSTEIQVPWLRLLKHVCETRQLNLTTMAQTIKNGVIEKYKKYDEDGREVFSH